MEEANLQAEQKQEKKVEQKQEEKVEKPKGPNIFDKLKNKLANYQRVVSVASKPTKDEFISSSKITGFGIALIGVIGFIIFVIYYLVV